MGGRPRRQSLFHRRASRFRGSVPLGLGLGVSMTFPPLRPGRPLGRRGIGPRGVQESGEQDSCHRREMAASPAQPGDLGKSTHCRGLEGGVGGPANGQTQVRLPPAGSLVEGHIVGRYT